MRKVLTVLSEAIRTRVTPASPRSQGERALALLDTDPRRALIAAEAIYDRFPESLDALELWAEINWRRGRVPEAKEAWQRYAEHDPESRQAWRSLARLARAEGRRDDQHKAALKAGASDLEALDLLLDTLDGPAAWDALRPHDAALAGWFAQHEIQTRAEVPTTGMAALHQRDRHRLIELEVNGQPLLAACDTGASGLVMAAHIADDYRLLSRGPLAWARQVRVGTASFENVPVSVLAFPDTFPVSALFGPDLFAASAIDIDLEANEFRWAPSTKNAEGSPLWFTGHHWITPVRIDGEEEPFVIDTGSPHTIVDDRLLRGEPFRGTYLPFRYVATMQGPQEVFYAPRTFLAGHSFELFHDCMTTRLLPNLAANAVRPAGLLGVDVVRRVRLDYPARRAVISC